MFDNAGLRGAAAQAAKDVASVINVKINPTAYPNGIMHWEYWMDRAIDAESKIHYNELTSAETERLDMLVEELSEAIQVAQKIKRHGYLSSHPNDMTITNKQLLERELGDVLGVLDKMVFEDDLDENEINKWSASKWSRSFKYTHHQTPET